MVKRFLLLMSGVLIVLSGPPSRMLADGDRSSGATPSTPVIVATASTAATVSTEGQNMSGTAFGDGNQEQ